MSNTPQTPGVVPGRLDPEAYRDNFADPAPPLGPDEAEAAATRCLFCTDAPCVAACPAGVDIPRFIGEIAGDAAEDAARSVFARNILGGMCGRVCPTERLCESVCVIADAPDGPVAIGRLERFAADTMVLRGVQPFDRAPSTGRRIAVVGAGPAGLACAHRLALHGHEVQLFDARPKPGGLNEYGIAVYKALDDYAQAEVAWLLGAGDIALETGKVLGRDITIDRLRCDFDAVFLAIGLGGVNALRAEGEAKSQVLDAVDFVARVRQADALSKVPVGRDVVVIGGGMTAVDAAVQAKLLGAERVTMVYRRSDAQMCATQEGRHLAASKGVRIVTGAAPLRLLGEGAVEAVEFAQTRETEDGLELTGETFRVKADQVLKAIGQHLDGVPDGIALSGRKIAVTGPGRTSLPDVWAGGDCAAGGDELTVTAVAEGRNAAEDIHAELTA